MATHFLIRYSDNHCETALHIHIHYVTYIIVECIHVATTPLELFKPVGKKCGKTGFILYTYTLKCASWTASPLSTHFMEASDSVEGEEDLEQAI